MTKTKAELKLALANCASPDCDCVKCPYRAHFACATEMSRDALELIMMLEAEVKQSAGNEGV